MYQPQPIKVMIVDDEEEIRLGVIKKINWEEHGFIVVGDAENGQDALEMAEKLHPDVIMTDIKMPFMDGLELGRKVTDIMPSTKIIIFSGSDDLEYAHKAIKINVVEYVLKPINSIELIEVLKRLKEKLDKEYDAKRNVETLRNHYVESIPVIREQFLIGALEGRITREKWIEDEKKLGLDFIEKYLSVAIIGVDGNISSNEEDLELQNDIGLLSISIKNIVDETMENYCKFISFPYLDKVVVLNSFNEKDNMMNFIKGLNEVCKVFECIFGGTISAGVGRICDDISKIRFSYSTAQSALNYRPILGKGKTIYMSLDVPEGAGSTAVAEQVTNIISNFYIDDYNVSSTPVIDAGDKVCFGISLNSADDDDSDNSYDTDNALGIDYDKLSKAFSDALGIDYEYEPDYSDNNIMG